MELSLSTPALLFPAISLLLLAYTSRFLTLANLMRELYARYKANPDPKVKGQLTNLSYRIGIIRNAGLWVASFFFSVLSVLLLFVEQEELYRYSAADWCCCWSHGAFAARGAGLHRALRLQVQDLDDDSQKDKETIR
jgi:hypothetical protein